MKKILTAAILFIFAGLTLAVSGDSFEYKKKTEETLARAREFQKKKDELQKVIKEFEKNSARRISRRKQDIKDLEREIGELKKELISETHKKRARRMEYRENSLRLETLRKETVRAMERYDAGIKSSIPYQPENRSVILNKILTDASFTSVNPEEIYHRSYEFLRKEYLRGFDSEVFTKGDSTCVRIGWVVLACHNAVRDRAGIYVKNEGRWELKTDISMSKNRAIRDAIKMLEGKKPPSVIEFPVPAGLPAGARGGEK